MTGAIVLGSDYRGLGAVQSLGRRGVEVWVLHDSGRGITPFSRYAARSMSWPLGPDKARVSFLLDLAERHGLDGWVLFPTRDDTVAMTARNADALGGVFRLTTPPWDVVQLVHDKRLANRLGKELGIPVPRTCRAGDEAARAGAVPFPALIKPAMRERENALTVDKAWPVRSREEFCARYADALRLLPPEEVMLQELIPGGGENQLSFAGLAVDGIVLRSLVARRVRQFPMDIGRASTFVITVDDPTVRDLASRLLARLRYTGLVEIEFKRDPRTGEPKLLDINPRLWGWHTLGRRAGMDFTALMWDLVLGRRPSEATAPAGVGWMWPAADLPTAARELARGRLRWREYLRSFRGPADFATLAWDDPLPGLLELPVQALARLRRTRVPGRLTPRSGTGPLPRPDTAAAGRAG